jgi:4-amino-4-deoxy-L-arabinose transferase-like glycosyltransferase
MTSVLTAPATDDLDAGHPRLAARPLTVLVAAVAAVHLSVLTRYGWHRDEFYYVICGRHLAWGYPDQPPLAPLLARLLDAGGLAGLRAGALAAHLGCIVATAMLARELGANRRAQLIAAGAIAACPLFAGATLLFGTTVLDQFFWAAVLLLVVRAVRVQTPAAWLLAGLVAGVGLETKQTVVVLLAAVLIGLAASRRHVLRSQWPWAAGAVAAALWAPNLWWDATHGWANVHMASVLAGRSGGTAGAVIQLPLAAMLAASPFLVPLWWSGARWLRRMPAHRWLLVASVVTVVVFTAAGGKPYYPAPVLGVLFAAGAMAAEGWGRVLALTASFVMAAVITLPFLPPAGASALRPLDPTVIETYGWPLVAEEVAAADRQTPQASIVFTSNYGEAGALTWYGRSAGLRLAVASAHNAYGFWRPPAGSDSEVLAVGEWDASYLRRFWGSVTELAPLTMPRGIVDEETANQAAIYLCEQPRGTWQQLWPTLRHLD